MQNLRLEQALRPGKVRESEIAKTQAELRLELKRIRKERRLLIRAHRKAALEAKEPVGGGIGGPNVAEKEPWPLQYAGVPTDELEDVRPPGWEERRASLPAIDKEISDYLKIDVGNDVVLENANLSGPHQHFLQKLISRGRGVQPHEALRGTPFDFTMRNCSW